MPLTFNQSALAAGEKKCPGIVVSDCRGWIIQKVSHEHVSNSKAPAPGQ
jgi:hypothetical protein